MRMLIMWGWLLVLAGCDSHVVLPSVPKVDVQPQDRLYDSQRSALEQARQLDGKMQRDADEQRQALDKQAQ